MILKWLFDRIMALIGLLFLWPILVVVAIFVRFPYVNGISEALFKVGMCLPAGPMVTDDDIDYIVQSIKEAIE